MGIIDAGLSLLGKSPNRVNPESDQTKEGVVSEKTDVLTITTDNEILSRVAHERKLKWEDSSVKSEMDKKGKENERYWKGEQYSPTQLDIARPMVDNAIFEAMETHIPMATKKNPEPMVSLSNSEEESEENVFYTKKLTKKLAEVADEIKLRLKLKTAARFNELYLLSVSKVGWDIEKNIPTLVVVRPEKLILDPDATVDPSEGYTGEYIGEYRTMRADALLVILKNSGGEKEGIKLVEDLVDKKKGTNIRFIEWWEDDKLYWTIGKEVIFKKTNINWNDALDGVEGINHFSSPKVPYIFLSVFNLGKTPVDETSNTSQNLANQDRLNKRNRQIDKAVDKQNGGSVVSLANAGLTQETVKPVARALQKGGVVAIPSGRPEDAVKNISGNSLPRDVYEDRNDVRNRIKDIWGTRGSSSSGLLQDRTVRGKFLNSQKDGDRVGGSVSEYLEQYADDIYNWFVQLLYVHDEAFDAQQKPPKIKVSVKEGSLLPKDSASVASEAIELANAGKMSLLDLYKRLDYSNPLEMASNAWLEVNAPEVLYSQDQRVASVMQQRAQSAQHAEQKAPSISIPFDSMTPDAQAQALRKAGIEANPEAIAMNREHKAGKDIERELRKAEHLSKLQSKDTKKPEKK